MLIIKETMNTLNTDSKKKSSKKCFFCRKKVGLFGLTCKCGNMYCRLHFHAENHECKYDFKEEFKSESLGGGTFKKIDKI